MRISQDVRDLAGHSGENPQDLIDQGMKDKAREFRSAGAAIYVDSLQLSRSGAGEAFLEPSSAPEVERNLSEA